MKHLQKTGAPCCLPCSWDPKWSRPLNWAKFRRRWRCRKSWVAAWMELPGAAMNSKIKSMCCFYVDPDEKRHQQRRQ